MLASPAYRSLSCYARTLLIELHRLYNGDNNGDLYMSVREAAKRIGTSTGTALKALRDLQDRGFIRPRQLGAFSYKFRHATTWVLTEFTFAGQLPEKAFMSWRAPRKQNTVSPRATVGITTCNIEKPAVAAALCITTCNIENEADGITTCNTDSLPAGGGDRHNDSGKPAWSSPTYESIERPRVIKKAKLPEGPSCGAGRLVASSSGNSTYRGRL
jgi:hypothetical protein